MYKYKNKKTGVVIETRSRIYGGDWKDLSAVGEHETEGAEAVDDAAEVTENLTPEEEPEAAEEPTDEPEQDENPAKKKGATIKPTKGK